MLSENQHAEYEEHGFVRLPAALPEDEAERMCGRIWGHLAVRHGVERARPATWTVDRATGLQALTRAGVFDALGETVVCAAIDDLLGPNGWSRPAHWGSPLVSFPGAGPWAVPSGQWHLDFAARGPARLLPGVRLLAFLAPVLPRGGGTLLLAGSHRLVERLVAAEPEAGRHSAEIRDALKERSPWLRRLWSKDDGADRDGFLAEGGCVDGVALRVVELSGAAGDVVLMHPWQFHAASPNCGASPRVMLSHSVFRSGVASPGE